MAVSVALLFGDSLYNTNIDVGESITFGSGKKDTVRVDSFSPSHIKISYSTNGQIDISSKPIDYYRKDVPLDSIIVIDRYLKIAVLLGEYSGESSKRIKLNYNCIWKFGRADNNDVTIKRPFVSNSHFLIKNEAGTTRAEDLGSTNGLYLNGKRIQVSKLKSGDILSIMNVRIKLINGELLFENIRDEDIIIRNNDSVAVDDSHVSANNSFIYYRRSPRLQSKLPENDIILASAPSKPQKFEKRRGMIPSLIGPGAMLATNVAMSAVSPALLAARAASMVSSASYVATSGGGNKKRKKKYEQLEAMRLQKYGAYIEDQKARIESVAEDQRRILTDENPDPASSMETVLRVKSRLWERSPGDRDFLDVRIGMGYEDLCVSVKARNESNNFQMDSDEARELSEQIIEETRIVDRIPYRLHLCNDTSIGIVGKRSKSIDIVKNIIVSLTSTHCFEDVKLVGVFDEGEQEIWEPLKWLPHIWDENQQYRNLSFGADDAHTICEDLNETLKNRKKLSGDNVNDNNTLQKPHYILIFGSKKVVEREELMSTLFPVKPSLGVTSIFMFDDLYSLPSECKRIIDVDNGPCAYDCDDSAKKEFFTPDRALNGKEFDLFSRRMSAVKLEGFSSLSGVPSSITFLQGYGVDNVNQLSIIERWNSDKKKTTLKAPIGMMSGGKLFYLDIHSKADGPHGLVAGTTGSGKSELLQTWILSMAVNYHPYDVSFVLIDYKGGGMANMLEPLPHVVGKITNIGSNITRSLISLQAENKRRQILFEKYGVNNIDKYIELYKKGQATEPLPHLIIVADEFAELKKEEPEFMSGLISVARIGRSLGVHLVLATQKPGGVVDDQIQSNSRFRLCLKVQDTSDSREMIRRPDAASITHAGRCYVLIGHDEYFDLFQSFWSGAKYRDNEKKDIITTNPIKIVSTSGKRISFSSNNSENNNSDDIDELTAIINYIKKVSEENGICGLKGPWLEELPENLDLKELIKGGFDGISWHGNPDFMKIPIGRFDSPSEQKQGTQYLDFLSDGHYGIYGAPCTGKTSLLKTVICSLCINFSPEDVNIYILDCGGWSMSVFSAMPHVGGIALDCEEEKFVKFEKLVNDEFESRKKKFLEYSVSSLTAYREVSGNKMPAIVIAVDNIVPIFDLYPDLENMFVKISREGATYGLYLIYTANSTSGVRYKITQNVKGAIAFELTDKGDYPSIVGRLDGMKLPGIPGRAFFKGNPPTAFQAALFSIGSNEKERSDFIGILASKMNVSWKGARPRPIPVMPDQIFIDDMEKQYSDMYIIPVGIEYSNICTSYIDLTNNYSLVVTGSINSGKSNYLLLLSNLICRKSDEAKVYVFDSLSKSLSSFRTAHKYAVVNDNDEIKESLDEVVESLNQRQRDFNSSKKDDEEGFDERAYSSKLVPICIVIDDIKEFVDQVSDDNKNTMERICRLARHLGVIVLCAGRTADLCKYNEIESLTRAIIANQNGVSLDGSPAQYSFFKNNLKFNEKNQEVSAGDGWVFTNGKCEKVKLIGGDNN